MKERNIRFLKYAASVICTVSMLVAAAPFAQAAEVSTISIDDLLRYSYISFISAGLTIEGSTAYCDGAYSAYDDYDAYMSIVLQRSNNQVTWTDIQKWYGNLSGAGPHALEGERRITKGYAYRVVAHVEINGKSAESISPVKQT